MEEKEEVGSEADGGGAASSDAEVGKGGGSGSDAGSEDGSGSDGGGGAGAGDDDDDDDVEGYKPPQDQFVELRVANMNPFLTCTVCGGYFRDAHTTVECLHTCEWLGECMGGGGGWRGGAWWGVVGSDPEYAFTGGVLAEDFG